MSKITIRDIAQKAGVSHITVSRALRGIEGVSDKEKKRIKKLAQQMGYCPNPLHSAHMFNIRKQRKERQANLVYLTGLKGPQAWKNNVPSFRIFNGLQACALAQGFNVDVVWGSDPDLSSNRLTSILLNRGVQGIFLAPLAYEAKRYQLDWSKFAVVAIGHSRREFAFNRIFSNHFDGFQQVMETIRARGYKKPGLYISRELDLRLNRCWSSLFLRFEHEWNKKRKQSFPFMLFQEESKEKFVEWMKRSRPDIVLAHSDSVYRWLVSDAYQIPEQIGYVGLNDDSKNKRITRMLRCFEPLGHSALQLMTSLLFNNQRGIPENAQTVTVDCQWYEGSTIRRLPEQ